MSEILFMAILSFVFLLLMVPVYFAYSSKAKDEKVKRAMREKNRQKGRVLPESFKRLPGSKVRLKRKRPKKACKAR